MTSAFRALINANDATANQRRAQVGNTMQKSISAAVSQQVGQTTSGTKLFSEADVRAEITARLAHYSPRQLAKFSGATPEGARHWIDGSRSPNLTNTLNLARNVPAVREWISEKLGHGGDAQVRALRDLVAEEVRAIVKEPPAPSAEPELDPRAVVRDLFARRA